MKTLVVMLAALFVATSGAMAGGVLELTPAVPGPYQPGELVEVGVSIVNDEGVGVTVLAMVLSFDDTDPALGLADEFTWDRSSLADDSGYGWAEQMPRPFVLISGPFLESSNVLTIDPGESLLLGTVTVTLPESAGEHVLDAMSATDGGGGISASANFIRDGYSFGDYWSPRDGSMTGGTVSMSVVPEPAMLLLVAVGGLAMLVPGFMRRRA